MTDEQRKRYDDAKDEILSRRTCPLCHVPLYDIGVRTEIDHMRGHLACPEHGCVLGDHSSTPNGLGEFLETSLCRLLKVA